jgi:hypothetical protein
MATAVVDHGDTLAHDAEAVGGTSNASATPRVTAGLHTLAR